MLALVVEFRIHEPYIEAFAAAITDNARASRDSEPGCRQFDVCRDPTNRSIFFLYELYEDESAIAAHLRSPHFLSMDNATRDWVDTKAVRRLTLAYP
jgi:(4S)-4-hydroxy-5-phosphonooxypentane-2,3-dione isomerase